MLVRVVSGQETSLSEVADGSAVEEMCAGDREESVMLVCSDTWGLTLSLRDRYSPVKMRLYYEVKESCCGRE